LENAKAVFQVHGNDAHAEEGVFLAAAETWRLKAESAQFSIKRRQTNV
jgi:hypothetical protein